MATPSDLCNTCGFCCNGLLYGLVDLTPREVEWATRRKLPLVRNGTEASMRQPCELFDSKCSAYDERPTQCREYTCRLLKRFVAGEVSFAEAVATIDRARALAVRVRAPTNDVRATMDAATLRWALIRDFDEGLKR